MDAPVAVAGPSAWQGPTLEERDWLVPLSPAPGHAASDPSAGPEDADAVDRVAQRLRHGPGLAVLRGLQLGNLSDEQCAEVGRRFIAPLGRVRPPDPHRPGDSLVTAVAGTPTPTPAPASTPSPARADRADRDDKDLSLHTDRAMFPGPPRLLGLMCIRPALDGGESVLVSGHAVHDRLLASRPQVLPELYREFHFGRDPGFERTYPVFRRGDGRLHVHYNRYWITRGQREHGAPLTTAQLAALDAFDEVLADPRMALRIRLRRGDLLLVDNAAILHGRTSFLDPPAPEPGRCLARIWLD